MKYNLPYINSIIKNTISSFNGKFKRATQKFYEYDIDELSDELKSMLLKLKHW